MNLEHNFTAADILASVRAAMLPEDRETADIERRFWDASAAFDANERAARQHLANIRAITVKADA